MKGFSAKEVARTLRAAAETLLMSASLDQAEDMFWKAALDIWGKETIEWIKPHFKPTALESPRTGESILTSLRYAPPVRAYGTVLAQRARYYQLVINPALLQRDEDFIRKIMIHEAVHIGYMKHDANFREIVHEHGGAVSESDASGEGIRVQKKEGSRFKTVKTFPSEEEAAARVWMRDQAAQQGSRFRMLM
jgi:hypothetical protein